MIIDRAMFMGTVYKKLGKVNSDYLKLLPTLYL